MSFTHRQFTNPSFQTWIHVTLKNSIYSLFKIHNQINHDGASPESGTNFEIMASVLVSVQERKKNMDRPGFLTVTQRHYPIPYHTTWSLIMTHYMAKNNEFLHVRNAVQSLLYSDHSLYNKNLSPTKKYFISRLTSG